MGLYRLVERYRRTSEAWTVYHGHGLSIQGRVCASQGEKEARTLSSRSFPALSRHLTCSLQDVSFISPSSPEPLVSRERRRRIRAPARIWRSPHLTVGRGAYRSLSSSRPPTRPARLSEVERAEVVLICSGIGAERLFRVRITHWVCGVCEAPVPPVRVPPRVQELIWPTSVSLATLSYRSSISSVDGLRFTLLPG